MSDRVLIIGAGQAGVQVALSLRQGGCTGQIVVVGGEQHVPYQRPPLSKQVLKKEWAAERCQLRHLKFFEEHDIELLLGVKATQLDAGARRVNLDNGDEWQYDALAICTGSRLNRLNVEGAGLAGVGYLRTIDDALDLSSKLDAGVRLAVIGGGYIGLEVAAAARGLGCEVQVIEVLDQLMKRSALPEIAGLLQRRHEDEGVRFHMGKRVVALSGNSHVDGVELDDGCRIDADVVMIGVGVRPDLRWLEGSDIEIQRGVCVDETCRTNVRDIYAAGDVSELLHPLLEGRQVLESVQNAVSQGKAVAAGMLGRKEPYAEAPWFWSEQFDCRLQMAGIPREGDRHVRRDNDETGGVSVFSVSGGRLNAIQCVNSPRDYMVGRQIITHQAEVSEEKLADQKFNLKDLL